MENADLIRPQCANGAVQHAAVMEQYEILFLPVVRVHQLNRSGAHERIRVR